MLDEGAMTMSKSIYSTSYTPLAVRHRALAFKRAGKKQKGKRLPSEQRWQLEGIRRAWMLVDNTKPMRSLFSPGNRVRLDPGEQRKLYAEMRKERIAFLRGFRSDQYPDNPMCVGTLRTHVIKGKKCKLHERKHDPMIRVIRMMVAVRAGRREQARLSEIMRVGRPKVRVQVWRKPGLELRANTTCWHTDSHGQWQKT
jgi:hypothetical protein